MPVTYVMPSCMKSHLATCAKSPLDIHLMSPMVYVMAFLMSHLTTPAMNLMTHLMTYPVAQYMASLITHQTAFPLAHLKAFHIAFAFTFLNTYLKTRSSIFPHGFVIQHLKAIHLKAIHLHIFTAPDSRHKCLVLSSVLKQGSLSHKPEGLSGKGKERGIEGK